MWLRPDTVPSADLCTLEIPPRPLRPCQEQAESQVMTPTQGSARVWVLLAPSHTAGPGSCLSREHSTHHPRRMVHWTHTTRVPQGIHPPGHTVTHTHHTGHAPHTYHLGYAPWDTHHRTCITWDTYHMTHASDMERVSHTEQAPHTGPHHTRDAHHTPVHREHGPHTDMHHTEGARTSCTTHTPHMC